MLSGEPFSEKYGHNRYEQIAKYHCYHGFVILPGDSLVEIQIACQDQKQGNIDHE